MTAADFGHIPIEEWQKKRDELERAARNAEQPASAEVGQLYSNIAGALETCDREAKQLLLKIECLRPLAQSIILKQPLMPSTVKIRKPISYRPLGNGDSRLPSEILMSCAESIAVAVVDECRTVRELYRVLLLRFCRRCPGDDSSLIEMVCRSDDEWLDVNRAAAALYFLRSVVAELAQTDVKTASYAFALARLLLNEVSFKDSLEKHKAVHHACNKLKDATNNAITDYRTDILQDLSRVGILVRTVLPCVPSSTLSSDTDTAKGSYQIVLPTIHVNRGLIQRSISLMSQAAKDEQDSNAAAPGGFSINLIKQSGNSILTRGTSSEAVASLVGKLAAWGRRTRK
ncbi:hypothetical protein GNI_101820 [Gregarina niphandrodes]|uniref:Uncharacterized protein n=1 Tax=Gregarina niphandrodes TaxID=110365 RepID=A0A023B4H4_GRENI|nr:hypothetical protein GNI_101820 [Gregarina niphandrodes]EZG56723.1 hypothetical protein GNI_101820 [Gregarina niphandrodes]|eukprot:XP_011131191.1 hypothetical protein GNI_101820 [Gregarina niphandrodes]